MIVTNTLFPQFAQRVRGAATRRGSRTSTPQNVFLTEDTIFLINIIETIVFLQRPIFFLLNRVMNLFLAGAATRRGSKTSTRQARSST